MPTVVEVLRQSGFSEEEIQRLDQRATTAFSQVLTQAEQDRQRAEAERLANIDFYETKIMPGLLGDDEQRQQLEAARVRAEREAAFYRSAAIGAGIVPGEEPSRDGQGRFVANAGGTPGSPSFVDPSELVRRAGEGMGMLADVAWKYESLYGAKMPIAPTELIAEGDKLGLDPMSYAARKFNFAAKEQELAKRRAEEHDAAIRAEAASARDRYWAERSGSNGDIRPAVAARMTEVAKAVRAGQAPDPLKMTDAQRRVATRQQIHKELAEHEAEGS